MHRYNIHPRNIETIKAVQHDTKWKPKVTANIAANVDKAIESLEHDRSDIKVFTDGLGMEGKIGAAAVLYRNGRMKTKLWYKLGLQQHGL